MQTGSQIPDWTFSGSPCHCPLSRYNACQSQPAFCEPQIVLLVANAKQGENRMGTPRLGHIVMFRPHYEEKLTVDDTGFAGGEITAIHYEGERYHSVNLIVTDKEGVRHDRHSIRLLKQPPKSQEERPYCMLIEDCAWMSAASQESTDDGEGVTPPAVEVPTPPATPVLDPSTDPAAEHAVESTVVPDTSGPTTTSGPSDPPSVPADPGATAADAELDEGE